MTKIMVMECDDDVCDHDDDSVAFTFGDALRNMRKLRPNGCTYTMVCRMALSVVRKQTELSSLGYQLYDWHLDNIAFHDTLTSQVLLVDWKDNSFRGGPVFKRFMTRAFHAFTQYLHDPEDQMGGPDWVMFMHDLKEVLNSWFLPLQQLPTEEDPRPRPTPLDPP